MTTPFLPTPADTQAARQQLEQLRAQPGSGASAAAPRLAELLEDPLGQLAAGRAVQVTALDNEIGTQQAAELLGVSRQSRAAPPPAPGRRAGLPGAAGPDAQ